MSSASRRSADEPRYAHERERMHRAVAQLLDTEGWRRWVRARSRNGLARYSVSNLCLILLAQPQATFVAGFRAWRSLGYSVRRGERAIRIYAPMRVGVGDHLADEAAREPPLRFATVAVFDRSQVDVRAGTEPSPLEPPSQPLIGNSHEHLIEPMILFLASLGYSVEYVDTPAGVGGWCDRSTRSVVIDGALTINSKLRVLIHETTHALGVDYERFSREHAEVIADTVAHIACARVGLRTDGETLPYVAGWGENDALEAVSRFATTIDAHTRRIEEVLMAVSAPRFAGEPARGPRASRPLA